MKTTGLGSGESKLETAISYLLIIGVVASLALEIVGMVLFYRAYGSLGISQDRSMFIHGRDFFTFIYSQFKEGPGKGLPLLFMTAGVVVLMLTPYIRVIMSVLYFGWEKNIKYVIITLFVLAVLTASLIFH